ncbi:hypothetical protein EC991_005609 [Linnemannia zychae]|nr:hypothetical protein EC991_005609 [Linnemannia zychae]
MDPAGGLTTNNQFLLVGNQGPKTFGYIYNTETQGWDSFQQESLNNVAAGSAIASSEDTESNLAVGMFKPRDGGFRPLVTKGSVPSARTGHCFVPNGNGSTYYVFGGTSTSGTSLLNDIYSYDVKNAAWSSLNKSTPRAATARSNMACAVQGDTLIIWGGFINADKVVANTTVLLYDIIGQAWKSNFTAPTNSGNDPGLPNPAGGHLGKDGSNLGPIIGGVAGGLAVVTLVAGFFIFRRRKARNAKPGIQVLPRNGPAPSNGKNPGRHASVSVDEYTSIPSPFASEDTTPPLYAVPPLHPISASLMYQKEPGSIISQPYSASLQVPPIPVRPTSGSPAAPKIQSPFEVGTGSSVCLPLLPVSSTTPTSGSLGGLVPASYHNQDYVQGGSEGRAGGVFSPSMEAAMTVDLIPIEASEAGDANNELGQEDEPLRTTTTASNRSMPSSPVHAKSRSYRSGGRKLHEDDAGGRRDSTETLEYLEVS